jgi:hypothetical protein
MERRSLRSATRYETVRRKRRVLFVVSREEPERFESLSQAFAGDDDVQVIFDRRHGERRRRADTPLTERRQRDRRSAARAWALRTIGWVRVSVTSRAW